MSTNKISKIRVKGIDYEVKDKKQSGSNTITSLTSIPNTKEQVIANLSGSTEFSLSNMEPGDTMEITCIPSADFDQSISGDNIKTTFETKKIIAKQNTPFKIYVDCYKTNNIIVDTDAQTDYTYYILVSTYADGDVTLKKYTNSDGSSTEDIIIPYSSDNYKIDGLIYGFKFDRSSSSQKSITKLDLSNFDTSNICIMNDMFIGCSNLTELDLSNFDTSNVTSMEYMFRNCSNLTELDLSNFDTSKVNSMSNMFFGCDKISKIKCKQAFKNWCWTNQDTIALPNAMKSGGGGTWEIVS